MQSHAERSEASRYVWGETLRYAQRDSEERAVKICQWTLQQPYSVSLVRECRAWHGGLQPTLRRTRLGQLQAISRLARLMRSHSAAVMLFAVPQTVDRWQAYNLRADAPYERMEGMALELYMLGLIVQDMPTALAFYRRLGLAIPDGSETQSHVEVKMGSGMTFFLDSKPTRWDPRFGTQSDPERSAAGDRYPVILEFYLKEQAALEAKYTELMDCGYQGFREPYATSFGMYFAMVKDPAGNTVLLSADAAPNRPANP